MSIMLEKHQTEASRVISYDHTEEKHRMYHQNGNEGYLCGPWEFFPQICDKFPREIVTGRFLIMN